MRLRFTERPSRHPSRESVDVHCHILPHIDDGPRDMATAIEMARVASASGVKAIVATPHLRRDFPKVRADEIGSRCQRLRDALANEGVPLEIIAGAEVSLNWAIEADDSLLRLASYGQRGGEILIETPETGGPMLPRLLESLRARGYRVILAHPERLSDFRDDPAALDQLRSEGIQLQINASSFSSNHRPTSRFVRELCRRGAVDVVASDGHGPGPWRPVSALPAASAVLERLVGATLAANLVLHAPSALATGVKPRPAPPSAR